MIEEATKYSCRSCGSTNIVKNGTNKCGNPQYHCKDCGAYRVLKPKEQIAQERKAEVVRACRERVSLRGVERIFGHARQSILRWFKQEAQTLPSLDDTLLPREPEHILEVDELWSFVGNKANTQWLWVVLCRHTRQIVAYDIGDRSIVTCYRLWRSIPLSYCSCDSFSDFYRAYHAIFPDDTHHCVGKDTGQTNHIERWFNSLRQRLARLTRKTLSFSKSQDHHALFIHDFIIHHNLACRASLTI